MVRIGRRGVLLLAAVGIWLLGPRAAGAYCRTTSSKLVQGQCPEPCVTDGIPLYWESPYLRYALDERGFTDFDAPALRATFAQAFRAWEEVRCGGEQVEIRVRAASATSSDSVGAESNVPEWNVNTVVLFTAEEWEENELPSLAFAVTGVWFKPSNGQIVGADMQFNGGMSRFGVCPDSGCARGQATTDLLNVATHEAGHFLGLAHSDDAESTMWCGAEAGEVDKRDLAADDSAGLCAAYPPGRTFRDAPTTIYSIGCTLQPIRTEGRGTALMLALVARGLWLRRKRIPPRGARREPGPRQPRSVR